MADRYRAKKISEFAKKLYPRYKAVLAMDIDEFLVIDPNVNQSLFDYLNHEFKYSSLSGLGLDVGQHPITEHQQCTYDGNDFRNQSQGLLLNLSHCLKN